MKICVINCVFQDIGAAGGGGERDKVGGSGRRLEQRSVASVASIQVVEHQETSVQPQGDPLQRYNTQLGCINSSTDIYVRIALE